MTIPSNRALRRDLETIFQSGTPAGLTDGQLLERVASYGGGRGDHAETEAAFSTLIERHGPMVLRVCRGVLGDPHEAEDAFQATFLVLFRQAGSIRKRESVGPWLHGVAHRVASCARSAAARRRAHERRWTERRHDRNPHAEPASVELDLPATIHAELARLPERYRAPIVLCDLEDNSLDEAARQLGWPLGTIKSRLNRGRQQLRDRLVRRGVAPGIAGLSLSGPVLMKTADAAIAVSPALAVATARMTAGAGNLPAAVLSLVGAFGRMMIMTRMKLVAVIAIATGLSAVGIGALAGGPRRGAGTVATARVVAGVASSQDAGAAAKAAPVKRKARPRLSDDSRREAITVSGRATDPTGRPVGGATVYVIDTNRRRAFDAGDVLATATTGPDGRFVAPDVELPVWKPAPGPLPAAEEGRFQVAGTAEGFGFTWHPSAVFRPADRPRASERKAPPAAEPEAFYRGEPIAIDLAFEPPASLHGEVTDDRGRPLADVKVQVGLVDDGRRDGGKTWSCGRVDPTESLPEERLAFDGIHALPESLLSTRTGPDGSYRIDGLPREARFVARVDPGPEFDAFTETIATTAGPIENVRSLGHDGALDRTFASPHEVRFTVRYSDTRQPARGATIRATSDREMLRGGGVAVTDADGRATLRLRPGEYGFAVEPPLGAYHLPARGSCRVAEEGIAEIGELHLEPAAIIAMEARDAKTGAGIEGVSFQYGTDSDSRRRELQSQLVIADRPRTDEQGRLRAIVEPGRKRFFVGAVPPGWKLEGRSSQPMILTAGREMPITWLFTRVEEPKADAGSGTALFPEDLAETWGRQDRRALPGKFRVRHHAYYLAGNAIPPDQLEAFLDANDLCKLADPAAALEARFTAMPEGSSSSCEIIDDGRRQRNTVRYPWQRGMTEVIVSNGREVVDYGNANAQSNIFGPVSGPSHQVLGWRDLCARPWVLARGRGRNRAMGRVHREESDGRLTVEETTADYTARWVVDRRTGFVYADSLRMTRGGGNDVIVRQYGPRSFRGGVVLPTVRVRAQMASIVLDIIDEVDLDYRPTPADFAVAAPAGTVILDYRDDGSRPKQAMNRYPVADVLAYTDMNPARHRSVEPILKVGRPAPAIEPASWLDRDGPTDPPEVAGKVVLVDFWGISCGFCVLELPEVQAAAAHFADKGKDLVIIGLHDSGGTTDQVAEFARKRGLTYRLAVDRPADEEGWFGATFKDYGVRGIPAAAVIDRKGQVAFVGRFPEALQEAAKLLGP